MRSEFQFIQNIKAKFGLGHVGDDCAVIPKDGKTDMVVTADMLVEGIDFRLDWTTPELLGRKALAVSLSDVAAMGAAPDWAMLSIGIPPGLWSDGFLDRFYTGWHELAREFEVEMIGGDTSRVPDQLVIDSIVGGSIPRGQAVLRSGASPGDSIYVTGTLGGAAAGLQLLQAGERLETACSASASLLLKHLQPEPRLDAAAHLRSGSIATAMIDISDGLSSDIAHLCEASGVGARIFEEAIPMQKLESDLEGTALENALDGGEDFELLFTVNEKNSPPELLSHFHRIGEVTANSGTVELITNGESRILEAKGYRHF